MKCKFSVVLLFSVLPLADLCARPQKPKREFQLQADLEDFWTLVDRDSKLSTVASGFGLTEGPVWDPAGFLIVSDEVLKAGDCDAVWHWSQVGVIDVTFRTAFLVLDGGKG